MISTSTTHHVAVRRQGVCRGTLWRQEVASSASNSSNSRTSKHAQSSVGSSAVSTSVSSSSSSGWSSSTGEAEYCTVTASWFLCHESYAAYERGDAPVHVYRIVGATENSTSNAIHNNHSFQLVTDQGTQLHCQALTEKCRDQWLATLHAGLELTLLQMSQQVEQQQATTDQEEDDNASFELAYSSSFGKLTPPSPQINTLPTPSSYTVRLVKKKTPKYCVSCGALETSPTKAIATAAPVFQYGLENCVSLCQECFVAQGLLNHLQVVQSCMASAQQEHHALLQARELCVKLVSAPKTRSTSNPNLVSIQTTNTTTPKANQKEENEKKEENATDEKEKTKELLVSNEQAEVSPKEEEEEEPAASQAQPEAAEKRSSLEPQAPPPSSAPPPPPPPSAAPNDDKHSDSSNESWTAVDKEEVADIASTKDSPAAAASTPTQNTQSTSSPVAAANHPTNSSSWIHISPTSKRTANLLKAIRDPKRFGAFMRVSPFLEGLSQDLLAGRIGVADFFEQLDDAVGKGEAAGLTALKKEAFRVAGDMGTAMKLLLDHALPKKASHSNSNDSNYYDEQYTHTQTLQCLLEFFLDLCRDGELSSVAFFWPQLCHIHLCMLPPENAFAVARVDLVEDFLLTVATQHSIQLAMELVWSHTADLEESLGPNMCAPACRARRFAVLRFVCELESYLFGHQDGWGGGSVTLGKMLSATGDQLLMLKRTFLQIQDYRRSALCLLPNSARNKKVSCHPETSSDELVQEKLRIAKNADYFTSHLNFSKRVCDIAEKLRFMEVKKRADALEEELNLLNSSGAMGGDPLNRVRTDDAFIRIVRVPSTEGHVFRSKERTPVLLLVEQIDEGAEHSPDSDSENGYESPNSKFKGIGKARQEEESDNEENEEDKNDAEEEEESSGEEEEDEDEQSSSSSPNPLDDSFRSSGRHSIEGSVFEDVSEDPRPHSHALKRFDGAAESPKGPNTPREVVDRIVTNVMVEQMKQMDDEQVKQLDLPILTEPEKELMQDVENKESTTTEQVQSDDPPKEVTLEADLVSSSSPNKAISQRRMFKNSTCDLTEQPNELAPTGDIRREVLNVIMMRGKQERNSIAAGTADSVQRSLKELETRRAMELLDENESGDSTGKDFEQLKSTSEKLTSLGLSGGKGFGDDTVVKPSEEDEIMEAVRLLLIQNRVAQGHLSPADAAKVLQHVSLSRVSSETEIEMHKKDGGMYPMDMPTIDAGDLDPRLAGCGPLPPAVLQALTLWKGEMVTNGELLELVKKDIAFVRHSVLLEAENVDKLKEDSAFWGRFAFGERWAEKKSRIAASSPQGVHPGWDLCGIIVKSNDDLRQEAFVMQLIELCQEAFEIAGLELWVSPYRILATGRTTGIIEMVRNAMSFDALKKRPGYGKGGLREHLQRMTEFTADPGSSFKSAQQNFVRSLAAYSLMSYFFLFKDRHNGNLLLDTAGHVIHIDFGFVFGVAPGGSFSLEMSTPFKLTEEMLEVMGGLNSPLFSDFVTLFCCGFLALQSYSDTFLTLVEITSRNSTFKCFDGQNRQDILSKLRDRFCPDLNKEETIAFALELIKQATTSYGTRQYDLFQYLSQGIAA